MEVSHYRLQKEALNDLGILYSNSIMDIAQNFEDAMASSYRYLSVISSDFAKTINKSSITKEK